MMGQGPSPASELLDEVARAVFDTTQGPSRLQPLLRRYDEEVGVILEDERHRDLLLATRLDWALCDAAIEGGAGPGDTWLRRAVRGEIEGLAVDPAWDRISATFVGLFEVWPGRRAFVRDLLHGISLPLADAVRLEPMPEGPAALWEVRIVIENGAARLCRPPLSYPLEILKTLDEQTLTRFRPDGAVLPLQALRRRWIQFHRASRADPVTWFSRLLP